MSEERKLTEKQAAFCREYLVDLNATQAAIRAGYSEDTASVIGSENLAKPYIQEIIQAERAKVAERTYISAEKVLREYARIAFGDIRKFYDAEGKIKNIADLDDDAAAALASIDIDELYEWADGAKINVGITKKIKTHNKLPALDALSKHLGLFTKDNEQKGAAIAALIPNITIYNNAPPLSTNEGEIKD